MSNIEIQPKNGSHYLIARGPDGKPIEISRHNSAAVAFQVRQQLMAELQRKHYGQVQQGRGVDLER